MSLVAEVIATDECWISVNIMEDIMFLAKQYEGHMDLRPNDEKDNDKWKAVLDTFRVIEVIGRWLKFTNKWNTIWSLGC